MYRRKPGTPRGRFGPAPCQELVTVALRLLSLGEMACILITANLSMVVALSTWRTAHR